MDRQMSFLTADTQTEKVIPTNEYCDTSVHSRDLLDRKKNNYRQKIYDFIRSMTQKGATCDEIQVMLKLRHETASGFIRFLTQDGFLIDSGDRRKTRTGRSAIVWMAVEG